MNTDPIYIILRNGKRWRHFSARQNALWYLAACCDLFPDDKWEIRVKSIEEVFS